MSRLNSKNLVSGEDPNNGSEFGGVGGLIQPPPHSPSASERLMMIHNIDPADDGTGEDSIAPPELEGDFSSRGYR